MNMIIAKQRQPGMLEQPCCEKDTHSRQEAEVQIFFSPSRSVRPKAPTALDAVEVIRKIRL